MGNKYRRGNYDTFRRRLNAPLVTVELAYDDQEFQLNDSDADILIQIRTAHVLWQTERLFNHAFAAVPSDCQKIAWIDCDFVFLEDDWSDSASELLDRFALVQLYEYLIDEKQDGDSRPLNSSDTTANSIASLLAKGEPITDLLRMNVSPNTGRNKGVAGGAWAARRDLLDKHGIYDACLLAGNDRAVVAAALGRFDITISNWLMNQRTAEHYLEWALPFYETVQGEIGFAPGTALHLWHGDPAHRAAKIRRYDGLVEFNFDPVHDIAIDDNGCWRWNSNKPDLHNYVHTFLTQREHFETLSTDDG
jgi:hypothetical protein